MPASPSPSREQLDELIQLYQTGQLPRAENTCRQLLQQIPDAFALNNLLGLILQGLGKLPDAVDAHNKAVDLEPDNARALSNRGMALMRLGRFEDALSDFDKAIVLLPSLDGAHSNRGLLLRKLGQLHEALASYEEAIQLQPGLAETYSNYGNVLKDLGRVEDAVANYQKAIKLNPNNVQAHSNLLMALNYLPETDSSRATAATKAFADLVQQNTQTVYSPQAISPNPERLRVGFVSGDLRQHPVGYFLEDVLPLLASNRLELFAYSTTPETDGLSERIRPCFKDWQAIYDKPNAGAAQLIHEQGIDILIDLAGHTANNRLPIFACKPAPVQLSWLGYFATTGIKEIDYLLTDHHLSPEGSESQFIERLWRLPETRWCFSSPKVDYQVTPLPALSNGYITLASCHNLTKINPRVVNLWAKLLKSLPGSRLIIKHSQLRDRQVRQTVLQDFVALDIEHDRLDLEGPEDRDRYLQAYQQVDIALDPFPFSGGATSIDGLWMGVPFVTLAGETLAGRQGVSILNNAGLGDWIANDEDQYVEKVLSLAGDLESLAALRQSLRQRLEESPLMDANRFADNFEKALFALWNQTARARSS